MAAIRIDLSLVLATLLGACLPSRAQTVDPEYRDLIRRGESQVRLGKTLMGSGAALLPLAALAYVPVLYDGAFGITAADPGFGTAFLVAGGGLTHAGIPVYGLGATKLEEAAGGLAPEGAPTAASGWTHYRRGWRFLLGGAAATAVLLPIAIVAALDWETDSAPVDYVATAVLASGAGLMAFGVLEQYYSLYRFTGAAGQARERLRAGPQVSLRPVFPVGKGGPGAGIRLACSF